MTPEEFRLFGKIRVLFTVMRLFLSFVMYSLYNFAMR
jgi:hypothetical protein